MTTKIILFTLVLVN